MYFSRAVLHYFWLLPTWGRIFMSWMPNLFQDCPHVPLAFSPEPICFTVHFFFSGFLSHQGLALVAIHFLLCSLLPLLFTIPAKRNQNDWTSHTSIGNLLYEAFHHLQFVPNETHLSQVLISLPPYQKRVPFSTSNRISPFPSGIQPKIPSYF